MTKPAPIATDKEHLSAIGNRRAAYSGKATLAEGALLLHLPLQYDGGDLGFGIHPEPWIEFMDATGIRYMTHSVEWLLRHIECFVPGRNQRQPLACAAFHYGLDSCALLGARND